MIFNMVGGGGGSGATLVVSSPVNVSVTVSKDDKSYTKNSGSLGSTTFKGLATGTWAVTISGNGQTATKTIEITADYAITIAFFSATISITYPATSTCVVTNSGGQTVASDTNTGSSTKTWTATVGATGTYTVTATATDGSGKTKSQSVSITADGQSENVELAYRTYFFMSGEGAKIKLFKVGYPPETTVLITDEKIELIGNSSYGGRSVYSNDKIDLTKYSKLYVDGEIYSATGTIPEYVGISSDRPSDSSQPSDTYGSGKHFRIAYQDMATERALTYLDISSYSGLYYVLIGGMNKAYIYNWWLE